MEEVKIVLDADVIIHFSKAECLSLLPEIFPMYNMVVLSVVYDELGAECTRQIDNISNLLKKMSVIKFEPNKEMKLEYAKLVSKFGKGESACMAYCRFTHNVIGSSNLKDIKDYCETHQMTYLTTLDFLYYAIQKGLMTKEDAENFVTTVQQKGSKLPTTDFDKFVSKAFL